MPHTFLMAGYYSVKHQNFRNSRFSDFHLFLADLQIMTVKYPHQDLKEVGQGPKSTETNPGFVSFVFLNIVGCWFLEWV